MSPSPVTASSGKPTAIRPLPAKHAALTGKPKGVAATVAGKISLSEIAVPLAVLAIVMAMITPLPAFLLDLLISANITLGVIVLMVSMYITRPVEFSVFPTALLLLTLFRLALNISSSRLILLEGNSGTSAAGDVIEAFGNFVVGGNYVIGVVIFLVLIAIQYVVINHGAVRISEVSARFTLDALPGKQMSIDSDLNSGLIDESEARARRKSLAAEAEFYGAMDGASRFTQRDAVASILITTINILAGFLIGVIQHGMDFQRALQTYTVLTIGDGLVTVIPALMISVSGGLVVTRGGSDSKLGADVAAQIFSRPQPLMLAGGVLAVLAAFPGLPKIPFLILAAGVGYSGWRLRQKTVTDEKLSLPAPAVVQQQQKESLETLLKVEPLAVEVGLGLVKFVDGGQNSPLLRRIGAIRRQLASDLGFLLPPVRVTDNLGLKVQEYLILLKGVEIARYEMVQNSELAIQSARDVAPIEGMKTRDPAFGMPAVWVPSARAEIAKSAGYTVVDPVSVLGTHLAEVIRRSAHELFSRQDTKKLLDRVSEENAKVIEDLVPKLLTMAAVQRVLQNLLRERVSIRDGVTILEALGEAAGLTKNPVLLTEFVRQSIRRSVVRPYLNPSGDLPAFLLDPALEQAIEGAVEHGEQASHLNLPPAKIREILDRIGKKITVTDSPVVLLAGSGCRHFLKQIVEASYSNVAVLSHNEVPAGVRVQSLGLMH
ncbi:MAG TPA: flagellar biosynthesis protein FlhA [Bryobacteraceae bacterium]|jgi:flagellar biosynthesis protein FlhA